MLGYNNLRYIQSLSCRDEAEHVMITLGQLLTQPPYNTGQNVAALLPRHDPTTIYVFKPVTSSSSEIHKKGQPC
jgi:hypothetical protein